MTLKEKLDEISIQFDVHHALRHARLQANRLPNRIEHQRFQEDLDQLIQSHWVYMLGLQYDIGRERKNK